MSERPHEPPRYLEIDTGRRRWAGWAGFAILFALVAALVVLLLFRFTRSHWLAIGLVAFMCIYMITIAVLASRRS
jgi:hypothetical protein